MTSELLRLRRWHVIGAAQRRENLRGTATSQLVRETHTAQRGLVRVNGDRPAHHAQAFHVRDEAVQKARISAANGERADRHLTSTLERGEKSALGGSIG